MSRLATGTLVALLSLSFAAASQAASVEIKNRSSWEIHILNVGPAGDPDWGPDQLGNEIIGTGETFTLTNIGCGRYDLQIIDEDGDACAIYDVALCDDKVWDITNQHLLSCQAEN